MKKIILAITAAIAFITPAAMQAEGFYAGAIGGLNFIQDDVKHLDLDYDAGYQVGIVGGYAWCNGIRTEAEISYRRNKLDHIKYRTEEGRYKSHHLCAHTRSFAYMANVLYDISTPWEITPFIGAGIGYADEHTRFSFNDLHVKGSKHGFAYQAIAGAAYPICDNVDLSLEYRFFKGQEDLYNHSLALGLKRFF